MFPNGEAFAENGGISSSSSPIPDLPPPKAESDSNCNLETELLCDESFNEIIKEEVEEEEVVSSDSLNERKRQPTDDEEEEDGNATEAVSDASKSPRIHEEEEEEQNGNQDSEQRERTERRNQESEVADGGNKEDHRGEEESEQNEGKEEKETEGGNQENSNGEEEINEEDENEEKGEEVETEELPQFSTDEEEGEKHELEEAMSKLGMWKEGRQSDANYYDHDCDYHQTLAILRAIWNFKCKTGNFPHPPSLKLLDFIMYLLPNLKISRETLAKKIIAFKNNYNDAWELDGDYPGLDRPVDREIFNLSMRLWGNQKEFYDD